MVFYVKLVSLLTVHCVQLKKKKTRQLYQCAVVVVCSDITMRSTRGIRRRHVFTTSLEVSAGLSIMVRLPSPTTHLAASANSPSLR